jgi:hypothetical protein
MLKAGITKYLSEVTFCWGATDGRLTPDRTDATGDGDSGKSAYQTNPKSNNLRQQQSYLETGDS